MFRTRRPSCDYRRFSPCGPVPDTSETLGTCRYLGLKYRHNTIAEQQVGAANDARSNTGLSILAARTFRCNTLHEFGFSHDPKFLGSVDPIHRRAFDKYGLPYVVLVGIVEQFLQQILVARSVPLVVMWIDDREVRFEGWLNGLRQPVLTGARGCTGLLSLCVFWYETGQ